MLVLACSQRQFDTPSDGTVLSMQNFRKKWNTIKYVSFFSFLSECSEYHCTIFLFFFCTISMLLDEIRAVLVGNGMERFLPLESSQIVHSRPMPLSLLKNLYSFICRKILPGFSTQMESALCVKHAHHNEGD